MRAAKRANQKVVEHLERKRSELEGLLIKKHKHYMSFIQAYRKMMGEASDAISKGAPILGPKIIKNWFRRESRAGSIFGPNLC